jgi:hypothetical protein
LPNGHPQNLERIRNASRFWSVVWQLGDFVYYLGFLAALGVPAGLSASGLLHDASFWSALVLCGMVLLACALLIPVCMFAGLALKAFSWRMAGLNGK